MKKKLSKYSKFNYTGANSKHVTCYNDNMNIQIVVTFYYISNGTNQTSVVVTVLKLNAKTS